MPQKLDQLHQRQQQQQQHPQLQLQAKSMLPTQKLPSVRLAEGQQTVAKLTPASVGLHEGNSNMIQANPTRETQQAAAQPNASAAWHHVDSKAWHLLSSLRLYQSQLSIHGRAPLGSNTIYLILGVATVMLGILMISVVMVGRPAEPQAEDHLSKRFSMEAMLGHACKPIGGGAPSDEAPAEEDIVSDKRLETYLTPDLIVQGKMNMNFQAVLVPSISLLKPDESVSVCDAARSKFLLVSAALHVDKEGSKLARSKSKIRFSLCASRGARGREKAHFMLGENNKVYDIFQKECHEPFASIAPAAVTQQVCHFLLNTRLDTHFNFVGNFSHRSHRVNVTDESGQLVASTEPYLETNGFYTLRVLSGMDLGLVLCALFCIERMEGQ